MNQLAIISMIPLEHATVSDVVISGALASQEANQNPIDLAFLATARPPAVYTARVIPHCDGVVVPLEIDITAVRDTGSATRLTRSTPTDSVASAHSPNCPVMG
jgi:hypothetical protein